MRILHATRSVNPTNGGTVEAIRQLSAALSALGHEVSVVSLDQENDPWVREFPFPIRALGQNSSTFGYSPTLIPWFRENACGFDGILCHGLWGFHGLAAWRTLANSSPGYSIFPHGMLDPWFKETYPLKHLKKSLYWLLCERFVLASARHVLFTSQEERDRAQLTFAPYRCREEIIALGTSRPSLSPEALRAVFLQQFPELADKRILLFFGRLHYKKGYDLLLEAFAKAPPGMHLVFAGPCDDPALLHQLKEQSLGKEISFLGLLGGDLKWGALAAAEAFILPSHQENFGMAVAESLAMGTPVLISNRVNIWREIQADNAGLVEPDSLEGTRNLLARWASANPARMREAASACYSRRFDIRSTATNIVALFQRHGP